MWLSGRWCCFVFLNCCYCYCLFLQWVMPCGCSTGQRHDNGPHINFILYKDKLSLTLKQLLMSLLSTAAEGALTWNRWTWSGDILKCSLFLGAFFFSLCCLSPCQAKGQGIITGPEHQSSTWTKQLMSRRKMSARYRVLIIHEDVAGSSLNEISAEPSSPSAPSPQGHTLTHRNKTNKKKPG